MFGRKSPKQKPSEVAPEERQRRAEAARAAAAAVKKPAKRRWRKLAKIALLTFAFLVVARIMLAIAMPWIVDASVKGMGLRAQYRSLGLSLLGGSLEVTDLELRPRREDASVSAPVVARVDRAFVDVDMTRLLRGRIAVHDVDLHGLEADLRRDATGRVFLGEEALLFDPQAKTPEGESADPSPSEEAGPPSFDFSLPLECSLFRVALTRITWRDAMLAKPVELVARADLRVENLGHQSHDARLQVHASVDGALAALDVDAAFFALGSDLRAQASLSVDGLRPTPLAPMLEAAGVQLHGDELDASLVASVEVAPHDRDREDAAKPVADLRAQVNLREIWLRRDRDVPISVDDVSLHVRKYNATSLAVEKLTIKEPRAALERLDDGRMVFGFVSFDPARELEVQVPPQAPAPSGPFGLRVDLVEVVDAALDFTDHVAEPTARLALRLPRVQVTEVEHGNAAPAPLRFEVDAAAPTVFGHARIEGQVARSEANGVATLGLEARLQVDDLQPLGLEYYLREAGIASELSPTARLRATVEAQVGLGSEATRVALRASDVALEDGDAAPGEEAAARAPKSLLLLPSLVLEAELRDSLVRVEKLIAEAAPIELRRDGEGAIHVFGIRTLVDTKVAPDKSAAATAPVPVAAKQAPLPSFEVDEVAVRGFALRFRDDFVEPASDFELSDVVLEASALGFGPGAKEREGSVSLRAKAAPLASIVALEARTVNAPAEFTLDAQLRAESLDAKCLDAYAQGSSIVVDDGRFACALRCSVQSGDPAALRLNGSIGPIQLNDGPHRWLAVEAIDFEGTSIADKAIDIGSWVVRKPSLRVAREANGRLVVAGLRLPVASPAGAVPATEAAEGAPSDRVAPSAPAAMPQLRIAGLEVESARLSWHDAMQAPAVDADFSLQAKLGAWALGGAEPLAYRVELAAGTVLDSLLLHGTCQIAPDASRAEVACQIEADGFKDGELAAYLPSGLEVAARSGRVRAHVEALYEARAEGNLAARLAVSRVDARDVGASQPWVAAASMRFALHSETSDAGARWILEEVVGDGIEALVRKDSGGGLEIAGLRIAPSVATPPTEVPSDEAPAATEVDTASSAVAGPVPTVVLEKSLLAVKSLRFIDDALGGEAVDLSLQVALPANTTLVAPDAATLPPFELRVDAVLRPFCEAVEGRFVIAPYISEPKLDMRLAVKGFHGDAVQRWAPELAKSIDLAALDGASLIADAEALLRIRRRSPIEFPLVDGFGAELHVKELALRAGPDKQALASLEALHVDVQRVLPRTGAVHLKEVHIQKPLLRVVLQEEGLMVAGVLLRTQGPGTEVAPSEAPAPATPLVAENTTAAATTPRGDFRLDLFTVDGLDFTLEDRSAEPVVVAPITGLDVEVKGFTTRAFREALPLSFQVYAEGGRIDLPERVDAGLFAGMAQAVVGATIGRKDEFVTEQRPFFGELAVQGRMSFVPQPEGFIKSSLDSLELLALRGLAQKAGVEIGDGVVDSGLQLRFLGERGMEVDTKTTFTYLSLDEPASGPISTYLKLPAPLDTVLFVLRNEEGEHVIPFSFSAPAGALGSGNVVGAAVASVAQVIGKAIAASPFRIVGGLVDLVDNGDDAVADPEAPLVDFEPASAMLPVTASTPLETALQRLAADSELVLVLRHAFSADDLKRAETLANPSKDEALALAERLRKKRAALLARRVQVANAADAAATLQQAAAVSEHRAELREIDQSLARTERALDSLFDLVKRGAERRHEGRAKRFALEIAAARQQVLRSELLRLGVPEDRIELRRPRIEVVPDGRPAQVALTTKKRATQ